jgi:hypothetical protein
MKTGARNSISGKVKSVKEGDIMSLVKFDVTAPHEMANRIGEGYGSEGWRSGEADRQSHPCPPG